MEKTRAELISAAKRAVGDRLNLPPDEYIRVEIGEERCVVTWLLPPAPQNVARGDFAARVVLDAQTGEALEVLAGS